MTRDLQEEVSCLSRTYGKIAVGERFLREVANMARAWCGEGPVCVSILFQQQPQTYDVLPCWPRLASSRSRPTVVSVVVTASAVHSALTAGALPCILWGARVRYVGSTMWVALMQATTPSS